MKPLVFIANFIIYILLWFGLTFMFCALFQDNYNEVVHEIGFRVFSVIVIVFIIVGLAVSDNDGGMLILKYPR